MKRIAVKCKHPRLDRFSRCKDCGRTIDITQKRPKYGNLRTDGFDSAKEAARFQALSIDQEISCLQIQFSYPLIVNGTIVAMYVADFVYWRAGELIVEDVKPRGKAFKKTAAYRMFTIKKKLMKACLGIEIQEI